MIKNRNEPDVRPLPRLSLLTVLLLAGIVLCGILLFLSEGGEGRTITVDDDGEGDYTSIQDAIDNATDGDTIRVWEGVYYENVIVNKSVSVIGNGSGVIVEGGGENRASAVRITADLVNVSGLLCTGSWVSGSFSLGTANCIFLQSHRSLLSPPPLSRKG